MSTVHFSVPDDVKQAFNDAFKGQNKSAVIAELMREAVARDMRRRESEEAYKRILKRRTKARSVSVARIQEIRTQGRS